MSPTQRTLKLLRDEGWTAGVVERWNSHAKIRQDFLGIIDIIALRGDTTLGVQATSASNVSARMKKLASSENIGALRDANWQIEVWGWRKTPKGRWVVRREDVS